MKNELNKYFMVIAKCGHVGKKNYIPIKFAVIAESGKEAAKKTRGYSRVKHNHKDAILDVKEVSYEEFLEIKEMNNNDPYLKCHSKQEQNKINGLEERMEIDNHSIKEEIDKDARKARVSHKLRKYALLEEFEEEDYNYAY